MDWLIGVIKTNKSWENIFAGVLIFAAFFGALFVVLSTLGAAGLLSQHVAAWVQAIGSIVAIYFAARIGRKQAETAFHIHSLDMDQRSRELRGEMDRQIQADEARVAQERENALAETAVHKVAMKRIDLQVILLHTDINVVAGAVENERDALSRLEEKRRALFSSSGGAELKNVSQDIDITNEHLSRAEDRLAGYALKLEELIEQLSELPRSVIRVASGKLADRVTSVINNLQNAVLEMEHTKMRLAIVRSVSAADYDLREYFRELDVLLKDRHLK